MPDIHTYSASDALAMLIAPLTPEQFFTEFYERSFYRTPKANPALCDLLTLDRVDEIISDSELPPTSVSMAKSGEPIPASEITFENGVVDRGALLDEFRNGATIILPQLHFADGKLFSFCLALEQQFGARTQSNIYLTPAGESGFGIHYDDHDVFVMQVAGAKDWEIYGDRDGLPYKGEGFRRDHDDVGELREQFVLRPGECLYVPRGTAHRAHTHGDETSLHITIGILTQTWAEFMIEAVAEASLRLPELRHALPRSLYFNDADRAAHREQFQRLAQAVADTASFDATLAVFAGNFVRTQGAQVRGALLALAEGIGADERFAVRDNILYSFEDAHEDGSAGRQMVLAGASIPLSEALAPLLEERIRGGNVSKADFTLEDTEEVDDIIGTLIAYGLLVRA